MLNDALLFRNISQNLSKMSSVTQYDSTQKGGLILMSAALEAYPVPLSDQGRVIVAKTTSKILFKPVYLCQLSMAETPFKKTVMIVDLQALQKKKKSSDSTGSVTSFQTLPWFVSIARGEVQGIRNSFGGHFMVSIDVVTVNQDERPTPPSPLQKTPP